jgi:hypothetical protein
MPLLNEKVLTQQLRIGEPTIQELVEEIFADPDIEMIEIPEEVVMFARILYQLYTRVINPNNDTLTLAHFISGTINDIIPIEHPSHADIVNVLYQEALTIN